jgi:hypothetical protein
MFDPMQQYLSPYKKDWLLHDGQEYAKRIGLKRPPRLALRSRDGLVLWYCQFRGEILRDGAFAQQVPPDSKLRLPKNEPPFPRPAGDDEAGVGCEEFDDAYNELDDPFDPFNH